VRSFLLFCLISTLLYAEKFSVASYNVKNLFDLEVSGHEYKEFIPRKEGWNKDKYDKKLHAIADILTHANKDIVGLQEIESKRAFLALLKLLPAYKYHQFIKSPKAAIGIGIISKYPILSYKGITINSHYGYRPILKALASLFLETEV